jgi:hypothetical protein
VRTHANTDLNLTCLSPASSFYGSPRLAPHAHTMTTARMHACMHCFAIDHDAPPPLPCKHHALLTTFATATAPALPLRLMADSDAAFRHRRAAALVLRSHPSTSMCRPGCPHTRTKVWHRHEQLSNLACTLCTFPQHTHTPPPPAPARPPNLPNCLAPCSHQPS